MRTRLIGQALRLCSSAVIAVLSISAWAECDGFIEWSSQSLTRYQQDHRIYPVSLELQQLAQRVMPALSTTEDSWRPIDFDEYLASAELFDGKQRRPIATGKNIRSTIQSLDKEAQCLSWLKAPDQAPAEVAPVYIQAYRDIGPTGQEGWLYFKYTYVFDWSGLARKRSLVSRIGSALAGGNAKRWHRLDVHTSAVVGLDPTKTIRTLTLQQHNNKRTYVAGLDFFTEESEPQQQKIHIAAAYSTNELYLDNGATTRQARRAVMSFQQWPYLIDENQRTSIWQLDEFDGRNAGGKPVPLRPVYIEPDHPLAAYAGLLAPKRRLLGMYIGRDGPPGYDFDGISELPESTTLGFWRENDEAFLQLLDEKLDGFRTTDWQSIVDYLRPRLADAIANESQD